jgi:hypothetical protein
MLSSGGVFAAGVEARTLPIQACLKNAGGARSIPRAAYAKITSC